MPGKVTFSDYWDAVASLLSKYEGRDRMMALVQYGALAVAAGEAGSLMSVSKNVGGARKPFRLGKQFELLMPLILGAAAFKKGPPHMRALNTAKVLSLTWYMSIDHVVWASSAGLFTLDKQTAGDLAKTGLKGWFVASVIQLGLELDALAKAQAKGDADAAGKKAYAAAQAAAQAALSASLSGVYELSPRATGIAGLISTCMQVYQMVPPIKPKGE